MRDGIERQAGETGETQACPHRRAMSQILRLIVVLLYAGASKLSAAAADAEHKHEDAILLGNARKLEPRHSHMVI